ncbi:hypothetical protein EI94DRAFT_1698492 [Lactarius quietus]|nr:hypothetical protein EI94DRAFT_1698492 [Lactarius quietus]
MATTTTVVIVIIIVGVIVFVVEHHCVCASHHWGRGKGEGVIIIMAVFKYAVVMVAVQVVMLTFPHLAQTDQCRHVLLVHLTVQDRSALSHTACTKAATYNHEPKLPHHHHQMTMKGWCHHNRVMTTAKHEHEDIHKGQQARPPSRPQPFTIMLPPHDDNDGVVTQ